MRVESGTTGERRARGFIFLVMAVAFAAWFAYDGFVGYPAKNLEWARQAMPEKPDNLATNPQVLTDRLGQIKKGTASEKLADLVGKPSLVQPKQLTFVGSRLKAIIALDDQEKVISMTTSQIEPGDRPEDPGILVTKTRVERIREGASVQEVSKELGKPAQTREKTLWFVGPAAYARVTMAEPKVVGAVEVYENQQRTEKDILVQKVIAAALAVLALIVAVRLLQAMRLRVVLDDTGLTISRKHVAWDSMTGLDAEDYAEKGRVDLKYRDGGASGSVRLDSYHIARFDEMVSAICERKGFESPIPPGANEKGREFAAGPAADDRPDKQR